MFSAWRRLRRRLRDALRGAGVAVFTQENLRIHLFAMALVIAAGFACSLSRWEWVAILLACAIVLTAEMLNTAIEFLGDAITQEHNERIGLAKDIAAGAVLVSALFAAIVGVVVFGPYLMNFSRLITE